MPLGCRTLGVMRLAVACALVAGVAVVVALAASGAARDEPADPPVRGAAAPAPRAATPSAQAPAERAVVLVRRRGGVPARWVDRLRRAPAVEALTRIERTQVLLRRSTTAGGRVRDAPPAGYALPLDALVVTPRGYAAVAAAGNAAPVAGLRRGRVLLSRAGARLRRVGRGGRLRTVAGRTLTVAGVVPDDLARDAELVVAAGDVPRAQRRNAQVLVATTDPRAIARVVPDDRLTRVAVLAPTSAAPSRGGIIRPAAVKRRFGEFAVRLPYGEDWIGIEPGWRRRTIVTRRVPILGSVTCHRAMFAPLRRALGRLERRGLARLVDTGDFAGCHAPRRIPGSGTLSLHAWGLAIDLNASENPQGSAPRQDRRLVSAFERAGFTWGGRWPTAPDGMHFELHG